MSIIKNIKGKHFQTEVLKMLIVKENKKNGTIKIIDLLRFWNGSIIYSNYTKKEAINDFKNR